MKEQSSIDKTKGTIVCPVCGKKEVVGENASGIASHWCKCGRIIESDYDKLTAKVIRPKKGATRQHAIQT